MSQEKNRCSRFVTTPENMCKSGSVFDANYYTRGFNFISVNNVLNFNNQNPTTGGIVPASKVLLFYNCLNQANGDVLPGLPLANCNINSAVSPVLSGTSCSNMVVGADYVFVYSIASGILTIQSVKITLWFANQALVSNSLISQSFSVSFQSELSSITYTKSGNPGYLYGSPVIAGKSLKNGTNIAVSYIPDQSFGITLLKDVPSTTGGPVGCTAGLADYNNRAPVTFGENTKTGCTMWLPYSNLTKGNCNALRAKIYSLQTLTAANIDMVGIFGNASVSNEFSDWVPIINSPPSSITGKGSVSFTIIVIYLLEF
jgi:hypothetical protein